MSRGRSTPRSPSTVFRELRGEVTAHLRGIAPDLPAQVLIAHMGDLVGIAERDGGLSEIGGWRAAQVDAVLAALRDEPLSTERRAALALLIGFLGASDRWTGDAAALDRISTLLNSGVSMMLRETAAGFHDPERELDAVRATDVYSLVLTFLRWMGPGTRTITATKALRLADTKALGDHLGLPSPSRKLSSMWDHPTIADLWSLCRRGGYVALDGQRAGISVAGLELLHGPGQEASTLVAFHLARDLFDSPDGLLGEDPPLTGIAELALAAVAGEGPELPDELFTVDPVELAVLMEVGIEDGALDLVVVLRALVDTEAFTEVGGRLAIVPGLESLVLRTLADLLDGGPISTGGTLLGQARSRQGGVQVHGEESLAASTMTLTVTLGDHRAEVWRRVAVAACSSLADLHRTLTEAFDREDDGHAFEGIEPIGRHHYWSDARADPRVPDDRATTVLDVVRRVGVLTWNVGPGFNEGYTITVDAVRPTGTEGLPRVLGRAGDSPTSRWR